MAGKKVDEMVVEQALFAVALTVRELDNRMVELKEINEVGKLEIIKAEQMETCLVVRLVVQSVQHLAKQKGIKSAMFWAVESAEEKVDWMERQVVDQMVSSKVELWADGTAGMMGGQLVMHQVERQVAQWDTQQVDMKDLKQDNL